MSLDLVPQIFGFCVLCITPLILRCKNINGNFNILHINLFLTTLDIFELMGVHFRNEFKRVLGMVT